MSKGLIFVIPILIVLVIGGGFYLSQKNKAETPATTTQTSPQNDSINPSFSNPKRSAHHEGNTPVHGSTLAGVPINVVVDFNFDLAKPSEIKIRSGQKEYGVGETIIDENKLAMRKNMDPNSPDGLYTINYNACWADGSCHDGSFQFQIDHTQAEQFTDLTARSEITINLKNFQFNPQKARISKGTKVIWVNLDDTVHTVNTDSHPAHTYYPGQNSRDLNQGDNYSIVFDKPGIYLYHCTPHADSMTGQ